MSSCLTASIDSTIFSARRRSSCYSLSQACTQIAKTLYQAALLAATSDNINMGSWPPELHRPLRRSCQSIGLLITSVAQFLRDVVSSSSSELDFESKFGCQQSHLTLNPRLIACFIVLKNPARPQHRLKRSHQLAHLLAILFHLVNHHGNLSAASNNVSRDEHDVSRGISVQGAKCLIMQTFALLLE